MAYKILWFKRWANKLDDLVDKSVDCVKWLKKLPEIKKLKEYYNQSKISKFPMNQNKILINVKK